ncbi:MerR family transcriptional regulator [Streptomyces sp. ACA25]|uniref:DNA polymerase III subunit beta family protein n=1 Tax=Streptomyces sp. ACA25 TaxID=3022596 RepID=UPI00230731FF|nr:MerR family transcriptional regulator [Streptomyces sp. ACA25]MDB1090220.1 MerR family transcriptional regulator [Streptomyces sp. ACA25]
MSRDSGLSVSTLRFYDGAGVLVPARVDPVSGYRWYAPEQLAEARLLARLRAAGMPLADIRLVLAGWSSTDTDLVRSLLSAHLRRLEHGLSDARRELSTVRVLLDRREKHLMSTTRSTSARLNVSASELAAALDTVRFAVGTDPELPTLHGVLFDIEDAALRVVATDRYRLAVARTEITGHDGPRVQIVVPTALVDAMRALLSDEDSAVLTVEGDHVTLDTGDRQTAGQSLGHEFPDYRRLVQLPSGRRIPINVHALRTAVQSGPVRPGDGHDRSQAPVDITVLTVTPDEVVTVVEEGESGKDHLACNRTFLLDALRAGARERLILELGGGPTAPLVIRRPDTEGSFSMLMPVRLEQ